MGSSFSQQLCCVVCERCRGQELEAADGESSDTKPILQSSGDTATLLDTQPPTPALKVPQQGSKDLQALIQDRRPSAEALEENGEPCSAADPVGRAEGWEAAWNPMDFFVTPADEEVEGEGKDSTQADNQPEKVKSAEEEIKADPDAPEAQPVADTAPGAEEEQPRAPGQPGSEGALCAGITLQERHILSLIEISSEAECGQGCEVELPADTREPLTGRDVLLCAVQVARETEPYLCAEHGEGTDRAQLAGISPPCAPRAELTCLVGAATLLTVQNPAEVTAGSVAELYSTSPVSWETLCPEWGSLEPPNQLLGCLKQELQCSLCPAQGTGSLCHAEPAGLGELLHQPRDGALRELGAEGSRECGPEPAAGEAEPQHGIVELPEEPATSVPTPAKQPAEVPNVAPSLPEALGISGEIEAENVEARDV